MGYKKVLQISAQNFLPTLTQSWMLVIGVFAVSEAMQGFYSYLSKTFTNGPDFTNPVFLLSLLGQILASLLSYAFYSMLIPKLLMESLDGSTPTSFMEFITLHIKDYSIESLRYATKVLLGIAFLILPGLYFLIRYTFVPFVVVADPKYKNGEVDAMERAHELSSGHMFAFIFSLTLLSLGSEVVRSQLRDAFPLYAGNWHIIPALFMFELFAFFLNILLFVGFRLKLRSEIY